jgi:hypothetical protein
MTSRATSARAGLARAAALRARQRQQLLDQASGPRHAGFEPLYRLVVPATGGFGPQRLHLQVERSQRRA